MMAQAADRKAEQWEAIANIFNGPFHYLTGLWNSVLAFFNRIGSGLMSAISNIHLPTLPKFVFPTISGAAIVGGIKSIIPKWDWNPPDWWPFNKNRNNEFPAGEPGGGGGGGSWGSDHENNSKSSEDNENTSTAEGSQNSQNGATNDGHVIRYDGKKPAPGMDSTYGKPGQLPLDAPVTSDPENRSPNLYEDVLNQFAVGDNPRYVPDKNGNTFCNTYAGDVARAMGVPLPQKREFGMNPKDKATIGFPQLYDFFTNPDAPVTASEMGWSQINTGDLSNLEAHVNQGKLAVVVNNGHIAVVKPNQKFTSFENIQISQAGATNSNNLTLSQGFGSSEKPQIFIIN
jgi:hypothetical protein